MKRKTVRATPRAGHQIRLFLGFEKQFLGHLALAPPGRCIRVAGQNAMKRKGSNSERAIKSKTNLCSTRHP